MPATPRCAVALTAALALVATIPTNTLAIADGLKETSTSTFTLMPEERKVAAQASIKLVNKMKSTVKRGPCKGAPRRTCKNTTYYYFQAWGPIVTPLDAVEVAVTGKKVEQVAAGSTAAGTSWVASFPKLLHKKKQVLGIDFDLLDNGPGSDQHTRVTEAYAHFCWYPETTDSGTAKAILPPGWASRSVGAPTQTKSSAAGGTVISTTKKKAPGGTIICTDALLPEAMVRSHVLAPSGQLITLSAWPDDPDWATTTSQVITEDLPVLEHTIGSPMPFASLTIQEVAHTNEFGYPSNLDPGSSSLLLDEDLDFEAAPLTALARTWFDDGSIGDPWLAGGLALWAGLSTTGYECPAPGAFPGNGSPDLHDWQVSDVPLNIEPALPSWQVLAACTIVEEVADLAGPARMRTIIDTLRTGPEPADWRDWLDAADELGLVPAGVTDLGLAERTLTTYGVATPADLDGRLSARSLYRDTSTAMAETPMPRFVDDLMDAWRFDEAVPAILDAKSAYDTIATDPALTDDVRTTLLGVFERADSADALYALVDAVESGLS